MTRDSGFRPPTEAETAWLHRLLTAEFTGRDEIAKQLHELQVRVIDDDGSLELKPTKDAPVATVKQSIPVEAEGRDEDGVPVYLLLFVENGYIKELEIYKADGSPIRRMPSASEFETMVLPFDWPSQS